MKTDAENKKEVLAFELQRKNKLRKKKRNLKLIARKVETLDADVPVSTEAKKKYETA